MNSVTPKDKSMASKADKLKPNQQELRIDLHVKHLKMQVDEATPIRIVWSRGKKQAKTQVKMLNTNISTAIFDEKF
jgi:hypothetical protein